MVGVDWWCMVDPLGSSPLGSSPLGRVDSGRRFLISPPVSEIFSLNGGVVGCDGGVTLGLGGRCGGPGTVQSQNII